MMRPAIALLTLCLLPASAAAADCAGNPSALGTARVLPVDAASTPRVGRKHFPVTLPLARKEVVLTFDDGPSPGNTERLLEALKGECVRATFFLIGHNAEEHPALARRIVAEGHTVGNHTYTHPWLDRMSQDRAEAQIDRGFAAIETALYGVAHKNPVTPFFRFPGFATTPALLDGLARRGVVTFGADVWASDWNRMTPGQTLRLVLDRLTATGGGIVLFHDIQPRTVAMIPEFLRELKRRNYRVVHVVAAGLDSSAARSRP